MKHSLTWAAGILGLLAALYVGSYYVLAVTPPPLPSDPVATYAADPDYRFGGDAAKTFFGPIHECDRRLRPQSWLRQAWPKGDGLPKCGGVQASP